MTDLEKKQSSFIYLLLHYKPLVEKWIQEGKPGISCFSPQFQFILKQIQTSFKEGLLLSKKTFVSAVKSDKDKIKERILLEATFNTCFSAYCQEGDYITLAADIVHTQNKEAIKGLVSDIKDIYNGKSDKEISDALIEASQKIKSSSAVIKDTITDKHKAFETEYTSYLVPPVDLLPSVLKNYINRTHSISGLPKDYIMAPMLSILGSSIGKTYCFWDEVNHWKEYPCIWTAIVSEPSSKKSAAIAPMIEVMETIDNKEYKNYEARYNIYKEELRHYKISKDNNKQLPTEPKPLKQILVQRFTYPKLIDILKHNKKGILIYHDEIAKLFKQCNKYDRGNDDIESTLELYNYKDIVSNIKGTGQDSLDTNIRIPEPFACVTGTIQPSKLNSLLADKHDDGFTSRFSVVYPDFSNETFERYFYGKKIDLSYKTDFNNLTKTLIEIPYNGQSNIVYIQDNAIDYFNELHKKGNRLVNKYHLQSQLQYAFRKSAGLIVRIALIIQIWRILM